MAGARTEAGPTAAVAGTRTAAVLMEAAGRAAPAVAGDISAPADRVGVARTSAAAEVAEGSEEAGRRGIRRRLGRMVARTVARRHASRVAIRQEPTVAGAMGAPAGPIVAHITVLVPEPVGLVMAMVGRGTPAATVGQHTAGAADPMAARDQAARTTTLTAIPAMDAAVPAHLQVAAIPG